MTRVHPTRRKRQLTSFQVPYWRNHIAPQWPERGGSFLLSLVVLPAMVLITSLCMVSLGQAQTPEAAFRSAIYTGPQPICPRLPASSTPSLGAGTRDLKDRCDELAPFNAVDAAMRQVAAEEVAAQGTQAVTTANRSIGARLAALRSVAKGIGPQRFALQPNGPTRPGTLVASLSPVAALSGTESAETPNPFGRLGIFANGTFSTGDKEVTSNEPGFDFKTYGATAGIDYRFTNNFILGVAFSYQAINADLDDVSTFGIPGRVNGGSVDTKGYIGSIYATYSVPNAFYMEGIFSLGRNDYNTERTIIYAVPGGTSVNQVVHGDTDGSQQSFSFGAGYDFNVGGLTLGPFVRVNYLRLDIDAYQEEIRNTNPGFGWALEFDSQSVESFTSVLGAQASYAISTGLGVLLPQVRVEWEHEFVNNSRTITARFVNDPVRAPIPFSTDAPDRDFFNIGVGLSATFRGGLSAFVYYETVLGLENITRHSVTMGVRKEL